MCACAQVEEKDGGDLGLWLSSPLHTQTFKLEIASSFVQGRRVDGITPSPWYKPPPKKSATALCRGRARPLVARLLAVRTLRSTMAAF